MSKESHQKFWIDRWQARDTPWHQQEVESFLIENVHLKKPARVLVPLCGQSLDMIWLKNQGHQVVGVELSEKAIEEFFKQHDLKFDIESASSFKVFRSEQISIIEGDFFDLKSEMCGPIDAIYDRAAFIAVSPSLRSDYLLQCKELAATSFLSPSFEWLLIGRQSSDQSREGPPYHLSFDDLKKLTQEWALVECLKTRERRSRSDHPQVVTEALYRIRAQS